MNHPFRFKLRGAPFVPACLLFLCLVTHANVSVDFSGTEIFASGKTGYCFSFSQTVHRENVTLFPPVNCRACHSQGLSSRSFNFSSSRTWKEQNKRETLRRMSKLGHKEVVICLPDSCSCLSTREDPIATVCSERTKFLAMVPSFPPAVSFAQNLFDANI